MSTTTDHDQPAEPDLRPATDEGAGSEHRGGTDAEPPKSAKSRVGTGPAPLFGQLVAVLLIALGVLGVQEAVARIGLAGTSWTSALLTRLDGIAAGFAAVVLGAVLVLLGLALLVVVVKPRPRKTLTVEARTGVFLRTGDLARIADSAAGGVDGVTDVDASASRGSLTVRVTTLDPASRDADIEREVQQRLQPTLDALTSPPRVTVDISHQELT